MQLSHLPFLLVAVAFAAEKRVFFLRWNGDQCYQITRKPAVQGDVCFDSVSRAMGRRGIVLSPNNRIVQYATGDLLVTDDENAAPDTGKFSPVPQELQLRLFTGPDCLVATRPIPPAPWADNNAAVGLANICSRSCWMNSLIQVLYHIPEFLGRLRYYAHKLGTTFDLGTVEGCLLAVSEFMDDNDLRVVKRSHMKEARKNPLTDLVLALNEARPSHDLIYYERQKFSLDEMDSHEMLQFLLQHLSDRFSVHTNPLLGSPLDGIFQISIEHVVTSHISGTVGAPTMQQSFGLDLYPPQNVRDKDIVPLSLMLELAFSPMETFDEDRGIVATTTTRTVKQLAPYLIVSINRGDARMDRLPFEVELPMSGLDLTDMVAENPLKDHLPYIYDLKSMVMHWGLDADEGHYTCALNCGDQWYHIDDASVSSTGRCVTSLMEGEVPRVFRKNVSYVVYQRRL